MFFYFCVPLIVFLSGGSSRYGCKVCAVFGGAGKWEMQKALKEGPEIVVATPGRMIELIKVKATNMRRCTMMVSQERRLGRWTPFLVLMGGGGGGSLGVCPRLKWVEGMYCSVVMTVGG